MKTLLSGLLLLMSFVLSGQDFKKIDEKNIDPKQKEFARKFASDYFSRQISGSSYHFRTDEAIYEMIKFHTPKKQKKVYNKKK